ncbi:hypothetical protein S83_032114, partial [Arachis hypogaea]
DHPPSPSTAWERWAACAPPQGATRRARPNARPGLVWRTTRITDIRAAGVSCARGNATSPSYYLEGASRGRRFSGCVHSGGASRCARTGSRLDLRRVPTWCGLF